MVLLIKVFKRDGTLREMLLSKRSRAILALMILPVDVDYRRFLRQPIAGEEVTARNYREPDGTYEHFPLLYVQRVWTPNQLYFFKKRREK